MTAQVIAITTQLQKIASENPSDTTTWVHSTFWYTVYEGTRPYATIRVSSLGEIQLETYKANQLAAVYSWERETAIKQPGVEEELTRYLKAVTRAVAIVNKVTESL